MTSFLERKTLAWLCLATIAIAGCEDPSNVGLGIIGEEGSEPTRLELGGVKLPDERTAVVTGGIRAGSVYSGPGRYLVGKADDPLFGLIEATAYVDYATPTTVPESFRNGTVDNVVLVFDRDAYVYGDTTLSTRFVLSDMNQAWAAFGTTSDTTLAAGDSVISIEYTATQGDFSLVMPEAWVSEHSDELIDEDFTNIFNGFQIRATEPSAVSGFLGLPAYMRVTTTTGSVDYPMSKILTTLTKESEPDHADRTVLQDGIGDNAILDFGFGVDSISAAAISRTVVEARVDLSVFEDLPANFVRPIPSQIDLVGIEPDGTRRVLRSAVIQNEGRLRFVSNSATPGEFTLVRSVQLAVTGNSQFEKYAIAIAGTQAGIGAALLYNGESVEDAPSAIITLVPTPFVP
jgi:hypothetical protein